MLRYLTATASGIALAMTSPALALANPGKHDTSPGGGIKTLVYPSNQCLITGKRSGDGADQAISAILGFLLPLATDFLFDQAAQELSRVRIKKSSGGVELPLWKLDQKSNPANKDTPYTIDKLVSNMPQCVTVLTGTFSASEESEVFSEIAGDRSLAPGVTLDALREHLEPLGVDIETVNMAMEARIVPTSDGTAFQYKPVFFKSFELLPGNGGARKQGLVYSLAFQGPGTTPWGTGYSTAAINMGQIKKGDELHIDDTDTEKQKRLTKLLTGKLATPGISRDAYATYLRNDYPRVAIRPGFRSEVAIKDGGLIYRYRVSEADADNKAHCSQEYEPFGPASSPIEDSYHCYFTIRTDPDGNPTYADAARIIPAATYAKDHFVPVQTKNGNDEFMPARFFAEVTQTKKPSSAAKVLASLLGKVKPKASAWAGGLFDADAKFAKQQADNKLEADYYAALAALKALEDKPDSDSNAVKAAELNLERAEAAYQRSLDD